MQVYIPTSADVVVITEGPLLVQNNYHSGNAMLRLEDPLGYAGFMSSRQITLKFGNVYHCCSKIISIQVMQCLSSKVLQGHAGFISSRQMFVTKNDTMSGLACVCLCIQQQRNLKVRLQSNIQVWSRTARPLTLKCKSSAH